MIKPENFGSKYLNKYNHFNEYIYVHLLRISFIVRCTQLNILETVLIKNQTKGSNSYNYINQKLKCQHLLIRCLQSLIYNSITCRIF